MHVNTVLDAGSVPVSQPLPLTVERAFAWSQQTWVYSLVFAKCYCYRLFIDRYDGIRASRYIWSPLNLGFNPASVIF